jgi:hypothetical protein
MNKEKMVVEAVYATAIFSFLVMWGITMSIAYEMFMLNI